MPRYDALPLRAVISCEEHAPDTCLSTIYHETVATLRLRCIQADKQLLFSNTQSKKKAYLKTAIQTS